MQRIVLLVDGKPLSRVMQRMIETSVADSEVVPVSSWLALQATLEHARVDLVVLDLTLLQRLDLEQKLGDVVDQYPDSGFVLFIDEYQSDVVYWSVAQGVRATILKASIPKAIADALQLAAEGSLTVPAPPMADSDIRNFGESQLQGMDADHREVLRRIMQGQAHTVIARELSLSNFELRAMIQLLMRFLRNRH